MELFFPILFGVIFVWLVLENITLIKLLRNIKTRIMIASPMIQKILDDYYELTGQYHEFDPRHSANIYKLQVNKGN